jgi:hypothetical protein
VEKTLVEKEVVESNVPTKDDQIRSLVQNYDAIAIFLQNLADESAINPGTHAEIVKSATLLRIFLRNQIVLVKQQFPNVFQEPVPTEEPCR